MDAFDALILGFLKKLLLLLLGMKDIQLMSDSFIPIASFGILISVIVIGEAVIIYTKSEKFKKRWEESKHKDLFINLLVAAGIITIVVVLL